MKTAILINYFALCTLPIFTFAQPIPQGLFIANSINKFGYPHILELANNKFYSYKFPIDVAGQILIETGTYEIADTLLILYTDTVASFSKNVNRLIFMNVTCDATIDLLYFTKSHPIIFLQENIHSNSMNLVKLTPATNNGVSNTLRRFGGLSIEKVKSFLNPPIGFEVKVCGN